MRIHGIWLLALAIFGCSPGAATVAATVSSPTPVATTPLAPGEEVREGVLEESKGFAVLGGAVLPPGVVGHKLGIDWRTTTVGKRVRARGVARPPHRCRPDEQCMYPDDVPIFEATTLERVGP